MKLLITIGSFYPAQKGGPDNSVFNFAKAALKGKDHVQVVCLFDSINDKLKIKHKIKENVSTKIENINIIYFKYYFFRIISPQYYLWLLFNLKKFDIIYINSLFFHISLYCILILNFFKKKIIISPRGELEENALRYKFILKKIYLSVLFFLIHKNTIFLVTSREEKIKTARNLPIRFKINILENLIDLSKPEFTNITNNFFRKNIVYLGRLHPKKNIEELIISYSSLRLETKKEHKLIIIGTGKDKYVTKLKELVLEKNLDQFVQFIGHKTGLEKTNLLSNSKMLVFPSHTENFGNVILEAYASYLPCICSKNTPWSVLDKLKIGYTYIPGSENLTSKIYKILSWDQNKYMDACLSGRNFINNKYSVDKNYHKVSAFLKKLIE